MSLDYDGMVRSLMRDCRVPREKAEAEARRQLGAPAIAPDPDAERNARILEKTEQLEIVKLFRAHGCKVYSLSQARASKQSPGLPDLWVTKAWTVTPIAGGLPHRRHLAFWWETKRQVGGKRSSAQIDFAEECIAAGVGYGFGDRYAAAQYLVDLGIAAP